MRLADRIASLSDSIESVIVCRGGNLSYSYKGHEAMDARLERVVEVESRVDQTALGLVIDRARDGDDAGHFLIFGVRNMQRLVVPVPNGHVSVRLPRECDPQEFVPAILAG
ncbi:MAG: hypothetical protein AB3N07_08235 [Ruegeria sp.]